MHHQAARDAAALLQKQKDTLAIWHFGASQRGRTWAHSDIDLLIVRAQPPAALERRALLGETPVHLHEWHEPAFRAALQPAGDPALHEAVATGELLFDRTRDFARAADELRPFPEPYRFHHLLPNLEALLRWARDLDKRMALGDERPRRAQHRSWEVDNHAANILLIERGHFPHNEPTTQALNARLFVPNLASPADIESFVAPRVQQWLLPHLAELPDFSAADLRAAFTIGSSDHLLDFAHRHGWLQLAPAKRGAPRLRELRYRLA